MSLFGIPIWSPDFFNLILLVAAPEVDSASIINHYQKYSWGLSAVGA
jgi:hypothetical protein